MQVAVDLYFGRTGVPPGAPARDLARVIASCAHLRFAGPAGVRRRRLAHARLRGAARQDRPPRWREAVATRRLIEADGIPCPMVSAGSTGSYRFDAEIDGLTELQPGSFIFMDADYAGIGGADGGEAYTDFRTRSRWSTTVVSVLGDEAIVDGGYKAFATDRPFTPEPIGEPGLTYAWAGDEHGRLDLRQAARRLGWATAWSSACRTAIPTVNLYDEIHVLRGDRVEDVWPIAARGKSQ